MRSTLSEFSFGFAMTDELIKQQRPYIISAPRFPSLREEGGSEGGFDMRLDRISVPLFLQFKLVHHMVRRNCTECRLGEFNPPFFRMKLIALKFSDQHDLLLALDNGINEVYYAAPLFTTQTDLNTHYLANQVLTHSVLIPPLIIGTLPDRNEHHITFDPGVTRAKLYSQKGRFIEKIDKADEIQKTFGDTVEEKGTVLRELLPELLFTMEAIVAERKRVNRRIFEKASSDESPATIASNMARYFFGCELLFIQKRND